MGCGCRSQRRSGQVGEILGYEYVSPQGVSSLGARGESGFMSLTEARVEQRAHGGGTIKLHRRLAAAK